MATTKLNEWLSVLTNIAVVAGIVFLAVEIRKNNELLKSETRQALLGNDQASLMIALANTDIFEKQGQPAVMSRADQLRFSFIYMVDLRNREFEYFQYLNGILDEVTWQSYRNLILINHTTPRGKLWWQKVGRQAVAPEFAEMVDEMLNNAPMIDLYDNMGTWDEGLE